MPLTNKEIRRLSVIGLILLLIVLSFLVLRPILLSITAGLILAYAFIPIYKRIYKVLKERNTSALAVSVLVLLVLFIPAWFLIPLIVQQAFDTFTYTQTLDISGFVAQVFSATSPKFQQEIASAASNFISTFISSSLNVLVGFLLELPTVLLHLSVIIFVFFFALRDHDKLGAFVSGLSPLKKEKEKVLVKQFKEITSSIVFGYVIVGIIQGVMTGIGLLIFGVPRAILLTLFAIFASIIPIVGPWLVWIPAAIYLFVSGNVGAGIGFTIYSVVIVSSIDNLLRPYIVSRKTGVSSVVVLVGMIGGLFVFGVLGILLGPLILSYLILFLKAYKDKTLSDMFTSE